MLGSSRFWPGLLALAVLWLVANVWSNAGVASDLSGRAANALGTDLLDKPKVAVAGRDATIDGAAFSPASAAAALAAVEGLPGIRLVTSRTQPIADAKPYEFEASHENGTLVLKGRVPDPAVRAKLLAAAKSALPRPPISRPWRCLRCVSCQASCRPRPPSRTVPIR